MSTVSRRAFLAFGAAAGGLVLSAPAGDLLGLRRSASPAADLASAEQWRGLVGRYVVATSASGTRLSLLVRSAVPLPADRRLTGRGCSVIFSGPLRPVIPAGSVRLGDRLLGTPTVWLQPVDLPRGHQAYQLIVDRRRPVGSNWR